MSRNAKLKTCAYEHRSFETNKCPRPVCREDDEYCLFHSDKLEEKAVKFNTEIARIKAGNPSILYKIGEKKGYEYCDFLGFKFPTEGGFLGHKFKRDADFRESEFLCGADFRGATFLGKAGFSFARFSSLTRFGSAIFFNSADFSGTIFAKDASFKEAEFKGYANFIESNFQGEAKFNDVKFSNLAIFRSTTFSGESIFVATDFSGEADFSNAAFLYYADFSRVLFLREANFIACKFSSDVDYCGVKFSGCTSFYGTQFSGDVYYMSVIFEKTVDFSKTVFLESIYFDDVKAYNILLDEISCNGIIYITEVEFSGKDLENPTTFKGVQLERANIVGEDLSYVSFHGAFIREVNFVRVTFGEKFRNFWWKLSCLLLGRTKYTMHEERLARSKSVIKEQIKYILKKTNEWLGGFLKRIKGEKLNDKKETSAVEKDRSPLKKRIESFGTAETAYAMLKHTMEARNAGKLARRMRACELEARLHGSAGFVEKVFLFLYHFLNGFGLRWCRALVFWLVCLISFSVFAYEDQQASYERLIPGSDGQFVRELVYEPLDRDDAILHSLEVSSVLPRASRHIENEAVRWPEALQRILSPFLFFLFLQALRNTIRD